MQQQQQQQQNKVETNLITFLFIRKKIKKNTT